MGRTVQIAIVGGSGSGKTWLAERLCALLGGAAVRLSLDDFYRDLSTLPPEERAAANFDEPAAVDWSCVRRVLEALARDAVVEAPRYDFASHTRRPSPRRVAARDFLVWDGLWLLHEAWLRACFAVGVYVDCPPAERLARRIVLDTRERGRSEASVRRQFEGQVIPMHRRHVEPQRDWATCRVVSPVDEATLRGLADRVRSLRCRPEP